MEEGIPFSQTDSTADSSSTLVPPSRLTIYFDPLQICQPEIAPNHVEYFKNEKAATKFKPIKPSKIRFLIMHPSQCSTKYDEMKTLTAEGKLIPSHLPNYDDLYGLHPAFRVLMLWEMENLTSYRPYDVLPRLYENLFDPLPKLSFDGPIYTIGDNPSRVCMGTYTDGLHIMKVMSSTTMLRVKVLSNMVDKAQSMAQLAHSRSFNEIVITPVSVKDCTFILPVEHGSKVVIWNARSIARPSFQGNFKTLCEKHDPLIVVVVEARITRKNVVDVIKKIKLDYKCAVVGDGGGLSGGVVMFYKKDDCTIRQVTCDLPNCVASVEFEGIFRHTPRKRLLDVTEISSDEDSEESQQI